MASLLTPDLCVIGAGASGLAVAEAARRIGASVMLVEKGEPGGSGLRSGALALSALSAAAEKAALAGRAAEFGVTVDPPVVSFRRVRDHVAEVLRVGAAHTGAPRIGALGIDLVPGSGHFSDPKTLMVGETAIEARRYVIATGATPVLPAVPGLLDVPYFTTETIFDNTRRLEHLVILGAGATGVELALSYRRLGAAVSVVAPARMLAQSDPELAAIALRRLIDEGVTLYEDATPVSIEARGEGIAVVLRNPEGQPVVEASHILVATTRIPSIESLDLDAANIRRAASGGLQLDASLRTSNPRVFAVGEAAGNGTHFNPLEADVVVRAALLGKAATYEPALLPRLTLTDPPIAEIGMTEPLAKVRMKGGYTILRRSFAENDLARARRDGMGLVKLVVGKSGRILGAGIVGAGAGDLIALFALAMAQNLEAKALATLATPYPSHAELLRGLGEEAAGPPPQTGLRAGPFSLKRLLP